MRRQAGAGTFACLARGWGRRGAQVRRVERPLLPEGGVLTSVSEGAASMGEVGCVVTRGGVV